MIQADARLLPLASNSVDLVVSAPPFGMNLARAKREIRRVLKLGKPAVLLEMRHRPAMWWWLHREEEEVCFARGRVLPPLEVPGWQRAHPEDVAILVDWWSSPGDLVVDPFAGSGTVERVAVELGRRAVSLDLEVPRETQNLTVVDRFSKGARI